MSVAKAPLPLHHARVVRAWAESSTLRGLAVAGIEPGTERGTEAEAALARHYVAPGQFVEVTLHGARSHFALASRPRTSPLELLFKRHGKVSEGLAALVAGDEIVLAGPSGVGFPVGDHAGHDLILCAAGSGIAPLRAAILELMPRRSAFGAITLYYSQRTPSELAYVHEWAAWAAAGIKVVPIVSGVSGRPDAWAGHFGRVPDVLAAARLEVKNAVAYVCGMRPMIGEVSQVLVDKGLERGKIFVNY